MTEPRWRTSKRTLVLAVILLASAGTAAAYFGLVYLNSSPCPTASNLRSFLIISDTSGFNDSKDHPLTLSIQKNDCVSITVENKDLQTHGLAVQTYLPNGMIVKAGETGSMRFYVTSTGQFRIWELVFSTIYISDRGVLNVTSVI